MSPRSRSRKNCPRPPVDIGELLAVLEAGLVPQDRLRSLTANWPMSFSPREGVADLVESGLLTAWQGAEVLAGRGKCLRLGPYRLLNRLGNGLASVYKAEHVHLGRLVAVKIIRGARRQQEIEAAASVDHPHVVRILDVLKLRRRFLLVMEYIDGPDLQEFLDQNGPVAIDSACAWVRQACLALAHLHERGIVHRDIKPANLILAESGDSRIPARLVKLLDLGLARVTEPGVVDELCGTPDYMAPERGIAGAPLDPRGDLYSLGCTLYQLITGQVPFPGGLGASKLLRHRLDLPIPVGVLCPEVTPPLAHLIAELMAREIEDRPASAGAVIAALDALSATHVEPATSVTGLTSVAGSTSVAGLEGGPPNRTPQRLPRLRSVLLAAMFGVLLGGSARLAFPEANAGVIGEQHPVVEKTKTQATSEFRVRVEGMDQPFATLRAAVAVASDGATLTLAGHGVWRIPPLDLRGKSLTLQGEAGNQLQLVRDPEMGGIWEPLIQANRNFRLRGLKLQMASPNESSPAPLIWQEGGELTVENCQLHTIGPAPLVVARQPKTVTIQGSVGVAEQVGISVEANGTQKQKIRLSGVTLRIQSGPGLSLWGADLAAEEAVEVDVQGSTIESARVLACRNLPGKLTIRMSENHLTFREGLISFAGYATQAMWETRTSWHSESNTFQPAQPWILSEGQRLAPSPANSSGAILR